MVIFCMYKKTGEMQAKNTEEKISFSNRLQQLLNSEVHEYHRSSDQWSPAAAECTVATREWSRCRLQQLESQAAGESISCRV
jgi:hypothetical protein